MSPFEIIKTTFKATKLALKAIKLFDYKSNDQENEESVFTKWLYSLDSFNYINDKRKLATERISNFCDDTGITTTYQATKDVLTSPNFARLLVIGSIVVSLALLPVFPVAPWIIGVSVGLSVGALVLGIGYEAYKKYDLSKIQKEDKLLYKVAELEADQIKAMGKAQEVFDNFKDPKTKADSLNVLKMIKAEAYKFSKPDGYEQRKHNTKLINVLGNSIFNHTPESFAPFVSAVISLNPISTALAGASFMLTFASSLKQNYSYQSNKATLFNNIENTKTALGITYQKDGVPILKDIVTLKEAENKALSCVIDKIFIASASSQPINKSDLMQEFTKIRDEEFAKNSQSKMNAVVEGTKDYFKSMGKVLIYGFSAEKTEQMFSPLAKSDAREIKHSENMRIIKEGTAQLIKQPEPMIQPESLAQPRSMTVDKWESREDKIREEKASAEVQIAP